MFTLGFSVCCFLPGRQPWQGRLQNLHAWVCTVLFEFRTCRKKRKKICTIASSKLHEQNCMRGLKTAACCTNATNTCRKMQKKRRKIAGKPTMNWRRCGVQDMRRRVCQLDCRVMALWAWLLLISPPAEKEKQRSNFSAIITGAC